MDGGMSTKDEHKRAAVEARITADDAERVAKAAEALAGAVVPRAEFDRQVNRQRFANVLMALALVGLFVLALGNRALFTELEDQTELLTECTTEDPNPEDDQNHECFDDAQRRQAIVVNQLLEGFSEETASQIDRVLRSLGIEPVDPAEPADRLPREIPPPPG
jgi:uncharacterized Zn finger protein